MPPSSQPCGRGVLFRRGKPPCVLKGRLAKKLVGGEGWGGTGWGGGKFAQDTSNVLYLGAFLPPVKRAEPLTGKPRWWTIGTGTQWCRSQPPRCQKGHLGASASCLENADQTFLTKWVE